MKQVADSEELQTRLGEENDADSLIALGAEHGCESSADDLTAGAELSDEELDGVAGGTNSDANTQSSSNYDAVSYLPEMGIIKGYEDGTFQPESSKNRVKWLMARIRSSRIG